MLWNFSPKATKSIRITPQLYDIVKNYYYKDNVPK